MWVKLKPNNNYKNVTTGRYYKVLEESFDPVDNEYTYLIEDDRFEQAFYSQDNFEEPVTHVRCINCTGCWGALTVDEVYEIIGINYVGAGLVIIEDDSGQTGQYSSKRFEFIEKGDNVQYTHAICKDNETVEHKLTYGGMYEIVESNDNMIKIVDDNDEYGWYAIVRFELITEEKEEPLEPLPQNIYHITYSLQYAEGAELADISKSNIIQIEGEIVSKGKVWVIETDKGTVIIPFKAIIHMHPQY